MIETGDIQQSRFLGTRDYIPFRRTYSPPSIPLASSTTTIVDIPKPSFHASTTLFLTIKSCLTETFDVIRFEDQFEPVRMTSWGRKVVDLPRLFLRHSRGRLVVRRLRSGSVL